MRRLSFYRDAFRTSALTLVISSLIVSEVSAATATLRGGEYEFDAPTPNRRRRQNEQVTVPNSFTGMDRNFVDLSIVAAKVARCVNEEFPSVWDGCDGAEFFDSTWGSDRALVVFSGGICFASFQNTKQNTDDWGQNLDSSIASDVCSPSSNLCCPSRQGYRDAYINTSYLQEFEDALETCKTTQCGEGTDCQVVLTGHSQGGAAAMVGAVFLNPDAVFTFGQPPTMEEPCNAYDTSRVYRFVNTIVRNGDLRYDPVPFLGFGSAVDHMGHMFTLGEDTRNVAYYRDHEAPDIPSSEFAILAVLEVHAMTLYIQRLEDLDVESSGGAIGLDGWAIGQKCSDLSSECAAPHFCGQGSCSRGLNNDRCDDGNDCQSSVCRRARWWSPKSCN